MIENDEPIEDYTIDSLVDNSPALPNALPEMVTCSRCSQYKPVGSTPGWCIDCEKAYNSRYLFLRKQNSEWMDIAKDSGLELYEKQPGETQLEWTIWQAYRNSYPGKKPQYKDVLKVVDTTYSTVRNTARRWNYSVRMQAWIAECDRITAEQRRQAVLDMNADNIDMARRLRAKMSAAIDMLDPAALSPGELNSLLKTTSELERKAHIDAASTEQERSVGVLEADNPELKRSPTKSNDLGEVVSILLQAGALGDITTIGVRKTETTEVVVADNKDSRASIIINEEDD